MKSGFKLAFLLAAAVSLIALSPARADTWSKKQVGQYQLAQSKGCPKGSYWDNRTRECKRA